MSLTRGSGVNVIGAGLAGSLLTLLLARRGFRVTVYERRADPRFNAPDGGRSINLALAARGIRGLQLAGVLDRVMPLAIPMRGRMVHEHDGSAELQPYGVRPDEVIYSVSRADLNRLLVDAADDLDEVDLKFNHTALGLAAGTHAIEMRDVSGRVFAAAAQPTIATDGAGSPVRHAMASHGLARVREEFLDHDYKELTIPPVNGAPVLDVNALHIWPRGGFMLIALPNRDASFTATLFLARKGPNSFEGLRDAAAVEAFFTREFPSALALMPDLVRDFLRNPQGQLGTIYTQGWHAGGDLLLLGDAAHAIVPFHGQGMNCAFEDCAELVRLLDLHEDWAGLFAAFEHERRPDTDAIAQMALDNYVEMRETVLDPVYRREKKLAEERERSDPAFISRYAQVMFHPEIPYSRIPRSTS